MTLDMEHPGSIHSPEQHSLSSSHLQESRHRMASSDDDRRSTSPEERSSPPNGDTGRQQQHRLPVANPPVESLPSAARSLKFSIEKILSPDFGRPVARRESVTAATLSDKGHHHAKDSNLSNTSHQNENAAPSRSGSDSDLQKNLMWPAWVYCTRYSDRPSSGPRSRRLKKKEKKPDEKRPRTAFTAEQLARLKQEFQENRYLTEKRRQDLARDLKLNESQIKIWFQNKRAKIKKASGQRNPLALQLMAQGLYNHSTVPLRDDEDDERPVSSCSS